MDRAGSFALLLLAGGAVAQAPLPPTTLTTARTDANANTLRAAVNGQAITVSSRDVAWTYCPSPPVQPDWVYGYAQTRGTTNERLTQVGSQAYARLFFRTNQTRLSADANAAGAGHDFGNSNLAIPAFLDGYVGFCASFGYPGGAAQKDIAFASAPSGQVVAPTANLRAVLTTPRVGLFYQPRFRITGTIVTPAGIQVVNVVTPIGGQTFVTALPAPPNRWRLTACRMTVPDGAVSGVPSVPTAADFKALYVAQYR